MTDRIVTYTIEPDVRRLQAAFARSSGKHYLADVIEHQPGRQIVRDGMGDVLHWLKECACSGDEGLCDYAAARRREAIEEIAAATHLAYAQIERAWTILTGSVKAAAASLDDFVLAPPPHPTGRAAQRSPYGPQRRR